MATTTPASADGRSPRFLQLADVAEVLNISVNQVYALVRRGDLVAVKIGGRGQWRVEADQLEAYIARLYEQTTEFITTHPYGEDDEDGQPPGP
ncbi:MAG TPA: helix-turn-helix domain-containing protein [Nocardioidaceae bacterium]|nr:helix-turn-helix domain-containing protein [Nocardioidaceae bacterium]